jgi:hypothetical protein
LEVLERYFKSVGIKQLLLKSLFVNTVSVESGTPAQLMEKYKLNNQAIVAAVER